MAEPRYRRITALRALDLLRELVAKRRRARRG